MKSIIDKLNNLVGNSLAYSETLGNIAKSGLDAESAAKLREMSGTRKAQAGELILLIPRLGGSVESSDRATDQEAVSWRLPEIYSQEEMGLLLQSLVRVERESLLDYGGLTGPQVEGIDIIDKHVLQGKATLKYVETALETYRRSNPTSE